MEALRQAFDFSDFPRTDLCVAVAVAVFLFVFPALPHSSFAMATMIQFLMFSVYGMGWNTIGGYGGQVDLGKAQYVGIGAYTTAVMQIRWDLPFWVSLPIGMSLAVGWSFIIGYPLFRLRGHYFAIATIATSLILKDVFESWSFIGGARGLKIPLRAEMPDFWFLQFREDYYYYYVILAFFFVGLIYLNWFRQSRIGMQLRCIKDNEEMARSLGIDSHWAKIKAYAVATAFVAAVGSFHACYNFNIEPEDVMSLDLSVLIALMAMLGGAGSLWGPIIGAAILVPMKNYLGAWFGAKAGLIGLDLIIYSTIIMAIAAFEPRGIWGIVTRIRQSRSD
ncbi:MAG: branched-chain amino acid ABC transporter permease [Desulfomonile tiedjei]|uniref:Branched-chain amino acid ABC transporter permease n=1 Tax=Desulfomonile tiedjei TaxID=2358 RepID=A0A9D6V4C6_9BACT|nr:branched-chain amino acid ABC transporter permease [Desulfomonile tiedjei]